MLERELEMQGTWETFENCSLRERTFALSASARVICETPAFPKTISSAVGFLCGSGIIPQAAVNPVDCFLHSCEVTVAHHSCFHMILFYPARLFSPVELLVMQSGKLMLCPLCKAHPLLCSLSLCPGH